MKRVILAALALAYVAFLAWGCASVHESAEGIVAWGAADEGMDSTQVEAKYFSPRGNQ